MLTFGFSTTLDFLSWIVVLTLGFKLLATLVLLNVSKDVWDRPGWGAVLWWSTKITPLIAVPCAIGIAWLQRMTDQIWIFVALMLFVVVAVPLKIRQRRARIADRTAAKPIEMPIKMQVISNDVGQALSFPDFEAGLRLDELALRIANALDTTARARAGSTLEQLVGFVGYPGQFALWWNGVTCELGCSSPCGIDMGEVADRLIASDAFARA